MDLGYLVLGRLVGGGLPRVVLQFVGLGLVYNLDKKTLDKMNSDLAAKKQLAQGEANK